jgi:N-acetyl-gamma-glutamyl-phosphate reductase
LSASVSVAVVGVTGYEGANVARLLAIHPHLRLTEAISRSAVGAPLGVALPALAASTPLIITEAVRDAELVILAVPHGPAAELAARYRREGRRVIDISADFRLRDAHVYATWYGQAHPAPHLLAEAIYGLSEWRHATLRDAQLVANPGCFPTAALLALLPALAAGAIEPDIIVDAKTGVSGAGRSPSRRVHFVETAESVTAYGVGGHRHLPEMEQECAGLRVGDVAPRITFIPHLVPMNRGILATCYATLRQGVTARDVEAAYLDRYRDTPCVHMSEQPPETGWVRGSNRCLISWRVDADRRRLVVISALDNLMKGGAGQAIQNANLMYGLAETAGLPLDGVWP